MKAAAAVAEILKREGVKFLIGYPVNPIIEAAAQADIRTIIVRQERTGLHMADAVSRVTSGKRIGVFTMQHGPGSENAFGGVAQAYGDSVPIVVLPGGYPRRITNIPPNFNSSLNYRHVTKWIEQVIMPDTVPDAMRRAFTQNHPLSLGSGGRSVSKQLHEFLKNSDVIFGIGCSFATTNYGVAMPRGKTIIHSTLDPADVNKDVRAEHALIGDAALTLDALLVEVKDRLKGKPRGRGPAVTAEIKRLKGEWMAQWMPKLTSNAKPISAYRVIRDLLQTVDPARTIITHDAGSPRDQISPFWECTEPLSYIGWGKTTQLGYGLGLAMGAKLAEPDKLCVNVWGDAAIGFTGMDFETAVRERIPIMSV